VASLKFGRFSTATTLFSPCKWSIFHRRYTMKEGLPTSITTTGVIPSSMRFKWSYYREISGVCHHCHCTFFGAAGTLIR
jgi:hypothetical protein